MLDTKLINFRLEVTENGKKVPSKADDFSGEMTLRDFAETMSFLIKDTANLALREEQANGSLKDPIFEVDGIRKSNIAGKVLPYSKIRIFERLAQNLQATKQVLLDIYKRLLTQSPKGSNQYASGHVVVHKNMVVAKDYTSFELYLSKLLELKPKDRIYFVNVAPYAGKLEREGTTASNSSNVKLVKSRDKNRKRQMMNTDNTGIVRRPNGVYFTTHRAFARQGFLTANFDFGFGFSQLTYLGVDGSSYPFYQRSTGKVMRRDFSPENRKYKGPYVYPYIMFKVRGDAYEFANRGGTA